MLTKTNAAAVHGVDAWTIEDEVNFGLIGNGHVFIKGIVARHILNIADIANCDILQNHDL